MKNANTLQRIVINPTISTMSHADIYVSINRYRILAKFLLSIQNTTNLPRASLWKNLKISIKTFRIQPSYQRGLLFCQLELKYSFQKLIKDFNKRIMVSL